MRNASAADGGQDRPFRGWGLKPGTNWEPHPDPPWPEAYPRYSDHPEELLQALNLHKVSSDQSTIPLKSPMVISLQVRGLYLKPQQFFCTLNSSHRKQHDFIKTIYPILYTWWGNTMNRTNHHWHCSERHLHINFTLAPLKSYPKGIIP